MKQSEAFLDGEGAAWLDRNEAKLKNVKNDPVIEAIEKYKIQPVHLLEVGCANGWRLDALHEIYGCRVMGLDPSNDAIAKNALIFRGTASDLSGFQYHPFDVIIYGWCLYLCDPEDYLQIAAEGDRILTDGGYLIVYDFHAEHPYKTPYKHKKELFSHHYDFSKLWLSHPAYSLYGRQVQDETSVTILHKNLKNAFPVQK